MRNGRVLFVVIGALGLFELVLACNDFTADWSQGQWAVSGTESDAEPGCPDEPTCDDTDPSQVTADNPQGYCKSRCDGDCVKKAYSAELVATSYNIEAPGMDLGVPEHTGSAVRSWDITVDDRFTDPNASYGATDGCAAQDNAPLNEHSRHPSLSPTNTPFVCAQENDQSKLYNHGRTIPWDECDIRQAAPPRFTGLSPRASDEEALADWETDLQDFRACTFGIPNGFCDVACTNCSYVIPACACGGTGGGCPQIYINPPGYWAGNSGTWDPTGAEFECSVQTPPSYYGAAVGGCSVLEDPASALTGFRFRKYLIPDPFTHCGTPMWGTNGNMCMTSDLGGGWQLYSGKWGHNSNTDFDAARAAFMACTFGDHGWNSDPGQLGTACGICGSTAPPQNGCAPTNTATTQHAFGAGCDGRGCDVDCDMPTQECGKAPGPHSGNPIANPTCPIGGFVVKGM